MKNNLAADIDESRLQESEIDDLDDDIAYQYKEAEEKIKHE